MSDHNSKRRVFLWLFYALLITLTLLPFLVSFSDALTRIVESTSLYKVIQKIVVPFEISIVASIVSLLHVPVTMQADGLNVDGRYLQLTWNCVGWQSLLFLLMSFVIGFQGRYTAFSILQAVAIGILGTFLINITRILFIVLLGAYAPSVFAVVFHDYLAVIVTLFWLLIFWWFSYSYVLEEKMPHSLPEGRI